MCNYPKKKKIISGFNRDITAIERLLVYRGYVRIEDVLSFDTDLYFDTDDNRIKNDISKVVGFSCSLSNHIESYRIGMLPREDKIDIYPYVYKCGDRMYSPRMCSVGYDKKVRYVVEVVDGLVRMLIYTYDMEEECLVGRYITKMESSPVIVKTCGIYVGGRLEGNKDWSIPYDVHFTRYCKRNIKS